MEKKESSVEKPVGVKEIMDYLGKGRTFVYNLMAKQILPYHQFGGVRFFYLSEVEAAIKKM